MYWCWDLITYVFELDFAYSTVCEVLILSNVGIAAQVVGSCMVGWCLDSPRGVGVSISNFDKEINKELPEDDIIEDRNMLECFLKCFKWF